MDNTTHTGTIRTNSKGFGFFQNEELEDAIFISPQDLLHSLNGDTVDVKILGRKEEGPYGKVTQIHERAKKRFTGVVDKKATTCFVVLDDTKAYVDFYIPRGNEGGAKDGDKVVVEFVSWKETLKNPTGSIKEILGRKGENNAEMQAIAIESGFDASFPEEVEREAQALKEKHSQVQSEDLEHREDLRDRTTLTIDPKTAKDFDDALSIKELSSTEYEVGIHIADVSHFVGFKSALDKEAYERGFSVYMVDRTIPMLPEVLSNDLCSLNPHEDKYAFSAIMTITKDGEVKDRRFTKSIIHSKRRFTYEEAEDIITSGSGEYYEELTALNSIAQKLGSQNKLAGSIEFETDEIRFELDSEGRPLKVVRKERLQTHKLVEELMLLANREVAGFLSKAVETEKIPLSIYRVHDLPQVDRIENYSELLRALGYKLPLTEEGSVTSKNLSAFLETLDGKAEEGLLKTAAIRSMSKALYSTDNIGHYGLAFDYYTHFTSPIRRYSDLVIHRLLLMVLMGQKIDRREAEFYSQMIPHITDREIAAVDAERSSIKYKHVEYMHSRIGQVFEGTITGVSEWGIYVEDNETKAEGMISLRKLDDSIIFEKEKYRVIAEKSKKIFRLGDSVTFRVVKADLDKKQLDYELVTEEEKAS